MCAIGRSVRPTGWGAGLARGDVESVCCDREGKHCVWSSFTEVVFCQRLVVILLICCSSVVIFIVSFSGDGAPVSSMRIDKTL